MVSCPECKYTHMSPAGCSMHRLPVIIVFYIGCNIVIQKELHNSQVAICCCNVELCHKHKQIHQLMKHQMNYNWVIVHYEVLPILKNKVISTIDLLILLQLHQKPLRFLGELPSYHGNARKLEPYSLYLSILPTLLSIMRGLNFGICFELN